LSSRIWLICCPDPRKCTFFGVLFALAARVMPRFFEGGVTRASRDSELSINTEAARSVYQNFWIVKHGPEVTHFRARRFAILLIGSSTQTAIAPNHSWTRLGEVIIAPALTLPYRRHPQRFSELWFTVSIRLDTCFYLVGGFMIFNCGCR